MSTISYRGATPMLDGKQVEIVYETCDGNKIPKYKIRGSDRWYRGDFTMHGYDHEIVLTEIV